MNLENDFDITRDRTESLENWTDIYLPLKLQHQITETLKDCLPRNGKYILGIADSLVCNQLRERIFTDIGRPELKERCLELIARLKIDAEILTKENKQTINEAKNKYDKAEGL